MGLLRLYDGDHPWKWRSLIPKPSAATGSSTTSAGARGPKVVAETYPWAKDGERPLETVERP